MIWIVQGHLATGEEVGTCAQRGSRGAGGSAGWGFQQSSRHERVRPEVSERLLQWLDPVVGPSGKGQKSVFLSPGIPAPRRPWGWRWSPQSLPRTSHQWGARAQSHRASSPVNTPEKQKSRGFTQSCTAGKQREARPPGPCGRTQEGVAGDGHCILKGHFSRSLLPGGQGLVLRCSDME